MQRTGDNAGEFIFILSVSDDGTVVEGLVNELDGQRTDGPVPVWRNVDILCAHDTKLLERWRRAGAGGM
jgi:hypothetical protein